MARARTPGPGSRIVELDQAGLALPRGTKVAGIVRVDDRVRVVSLGYADIDAGTPEHDPRQRALAVLGQEFTLDLEPLRTDVLVIPSTRSGTAPTSPGVVRDGPDLVLTTVTEYIGDLPDRPGIVLAPDRPGIVLAWGSKGWRLVGDAPACRRRELPSAWVGDAVTVRMTGPMSMECVESTGAVRWRLRLRQWLYTPVEFRGDRIYFGTAGRGGRFLGVDLRTGEVAVDVYTGGTIDYRWFDDHRVVLADDGILLAETQTGTIVRRVQLGPVSPIDTRRMLLDGDTVFTPALRRTGDRSKSWIAQVKLGPGRG